MISLLPTPQLLSPSSTKTSSFIFFLLPPLQSCFVFFFTNSHHLSHTIVAPLYNHHITTKQRHLSFVLFLLFLHISQTHYWKLQRVAKPLRLYLMSNSNNSKPGGSNTEQLLCQGSNFTGTSKDTIETEFFVVQIIVIFT